MSLPRSAKITGQVIASGILALAIALGPARVPARAAHTRTGYPPLVIAVTNTGAGTPFVRHFNLLQGYGAQPAAVTYEMYEPLYIVDNVNFKEYPWLATSYKWSKDLRTLTFTILHGVRWSDGVPFSAQDVYYTWAVLAKKYSAADLIGLWSKGGQNEADRVTMPAPDQVAIHFKTVNTTHFGNWTGVADNSAILPKHIWSKVKDPMTWANPNPVGTGPFTQVKNFSQQSFDVGRNPYYWQKGKPMFDTLRIVGYTSYDAANLALEAGQVDWSGNLIPHADRVYDARKPGYFHHFYAPDYASEPLYTNDLRYPYSLVAFRKALSMAINRMALDINANYGYAPPTDVTGFPRGIMARWRNPSIPNTLVEYHPNKARALLKKAGFTWQNGALFDPRGHRVSIELLPTFTPSEAPIIEQNLKALGIDASVRVLQFNSYYDRMLKGHFDLVDGWGWGVGPTPYDVYNVTLSGAYFAPMGKPAGGSNFERWKNPEMDRLLTAFVQTNDFHKQRELGYRMQHIYVDNLPVILTVEAPIPENYSTVNYTGFPTPQNNYAYAQPFGWPGTDTVLMLTRIHPSH